MKVIFISILFFTFSVDAKKRVWSVYAENYPPYIYYENMSIKGLSIDVIKEVFRDANIDYNIYILPWARALKQTSIEKNSIILSIAKTPERESKFKWLEPLHTIEIYEWCLNFCPQSKDYKNVKVAITRDVVMKEHLKSVTQHNLFPVSTPTQSFKMLVKKRVDVVYQPLEVFMEFKANNTLVDFTNIVQGNLVLSVPAHVAINISSSLDDVKKLRDAYSSFLQSPKMKLLHKKYQ